VNEHEHEHERDQPAGPDPRSADERRARRAIMRAARVLIGTILLLLLLGLVVRALRDAG
jgi:hypothetical protein